MIKKIYVLLLLIIMQLTATAQLLDYNRISTDDGLASNFVNATYLDNKGFLWIATESGVQRYDGRHFLNIMPKGKMNKRSVTHVHQIIGGKGPYLWLRIGNSIQKLHTGTFEFTPVLLKVREDINIHNGTFLWADSHKRIFLLVYGGPVLMYDEAANAFTSSNLPFNLPGNLPVNHIFEDTVHQRYWLSTDSGLYMSTGKSDSFQYAFNNPSKLSVLNTTVASSPVNMLFIDSRRRYWIMTDNQTGTAARIVCYDEHLQRFTTDTVGINGANLSMVTRMNEMKNGGIWLYGGELLKCWAPVAGTFESQKMSLPFEYGIKYKEVNFLMEDGNGCVWISTDHGLYITLPEPTRLAHWDFAFDDKKTIPDDRTLSLYQSKDRSIIYGRRKSGLNVYDYRHRPVCTINSFAKGQYKALDKDYDCVQSIIQTKADGLILAGCNNGKFILYNPDNGNIQYGNIAEFKGAGLSALAEDEKGSLWVGLSNGELFRRMAGEKIFQFVERYEKRISHIFIDREAIIWVAVNSDGVYAINGMRDQRLYHLSDREDEMLGLRPQSQRMQQDKDRVLFGRYSSISTLSDNNVNALVQLNDSMIAIGCLGLDLFNKRTKAVVNYGVAEGLAGTHIGGMALDQEGQLWMATTSGICRYNPGRNIFIRYNKYNMLTGGTNGNNLFTTALCSMSGKMIFAGNQGLLFFDPEFFTYRNAPPRVTITELRLLDTLLPPVAYTEGAAPLQLSWKENAVSFSFAALSFLQRDQLTYYYQLEGVDKEWKLAGSTLKADYTQLPAGDYTFKVRCRNEAGVLSSVTKVQLSIRPPFWQTWWFITLVVLLLGTIVFVLYRIRVKHIMALQNIRMKVARDLHDDMGATLSTINILSEMARMKMEENTPARSFVDKISENSVQMQEAMDDIVWSINPGNDQVEKIIARMRAFAADILEARNIDCTITGEETLMGVKLDMDKRRDVFLIFKEAINNAAKYSAATTVIVALRLVDQQLEMSIRDNGKGFDVAQADNGNGLGNMRKRALRLHAELTIHSVKDLGTQINLSMPVKTK